MSRRLGSFRWLATQSVVTRTSGCAYSVMRNSSFRDNILSGQFPSGLQVADAPLTRQSSAASGKAALWRRRVMPAPTRFEPKGCPAGLGRLSRLESAAPCLEFYSKNPVVVKPFVAKPLFERVSIGRVEFDQHFAFDHVDLQ